MSETADGGIYRAVANITSQTKERPSILTHQMCPDGIKLVGETKQPDDPSLRG